MPDERYFFLHLQKTGGLALLERLRRQFDWPGVYPSPDDGAPPATVISVPYLLDRWAARGDEIRVVTGHFPLCTTELLGGSFRTFTVLREPVARTLSFLRYHRYMTPEDRDTPLEEIYDDEARFEGLIHNHMVKMLALRPEEMADGVLTRVDFTPEHLERAKAALLTIDVVGVQEHFEHFCRELADRFSWTGLGDPYRANTTKPEAVDPAFARRIEADNALDCELYDVARAKVSKST